MNDAPILYLLAAMLLVIGGALTLVGSWGLVRLPTIMERLHGPTKATTLGLGALLLASVLSLRAQTGEWSAHELLVTLFLFITAPVSANLIAKVHLHRAGHRIDGEEPGPAGPPPPVPGGWATMTGDEAGDADDRAE